MLKHQDLAEVDANLVRRGIVDATNLRAEIEQFLGGLSSLPHYRLQDGGGHIHYLVQAAALLPLIDWMSAHPRLTCHAIFAPPRKPKPSDKAMRLAQLSDGDILNLARLQLPRLRPQDSPISLHVYDRTGPAEHTARLASQAPMRTIDFDAMSASYKGYRIGKPTSMISKVPFKMTRVTEDAPIDLGPIDVVYTWVDSGDPNWQGKFARHIGRHTTTTHGSELRYLSRDELRYSIRSVLKYAPWVRNIYIVTDDQRPDWFVGNDRIKIVDHRDIFPDPSVLPVFNSHAIESCLHRIPGLAERFLYFNDDVFLGCPTSPEDFFSPGGRAKTYMSGRLSFSKEWIAAGTLPTDAALCTTIRLIEARFGFTPVAKVQHTPHPMLKSVLQLIEAEHPEGLARTRAARLRSDTDMNLTGNLAYYYCHGLNLGTWPEQGVSVYRYIDTGRLDHMKTLHRLILSPVKFFCLNLTYHKEVSFSRQALLLRLLFLWMFPRRGSHERSRLRSAARRLFRLGRASV